MISRLQTAEIDTIFVQTFNKLSKELLDKNTYYDMLNCLTSYNNDKSIKTVYFTIIVLDSLISLII